MGNNQRYIFAERLKEIRTEKRLSQSELAAMIGVSQANIARWEREVQDASSRSVYELAQKLGVSADYLLGLKNED